MNQREAVFQSTMAVLAENNINFIVGESVIHDVMTKEMKSAVVSRVSELFNSNTVSFKDKASNLAKLSNPKELNKYVIGLVTNWFNKDKDLNAGAQYETKNPGSRIGASDAQLKELKNFRARVEASGNTEGLAKIDEAIQARITELKTELISKKLPEVDLSKIPEHLRGLIE